MGSPFTEREQALLEQRAARMAGEVAPRGARTERVVTFRRGEGRYALAAADLRRVAPLPKLTRVPWLPAHLPGVVNLGGRALGVLDLERLERPEAPLPSVPWAVWLSRDSRSVVLVADELIDVVDVPEALLAGGLRGAFSGRLATLTRAMLPGPLLALDANLLLNPELFQPLKR